MLTDEEMDEEAAYWQAKDDMLMRVANDTAAAESLELQQREEDYLIAHCEHRDQGVEPLTNNPNGPTALVCYECRTTLREETQ